MKIQYIPGVTGDTCASEGFADKKKQVQNISNYELSKTHDN